MELTDCSCTEHSEALSPPILVHALHRQVGRQADKQTDKQTDGKTAKHASLLSIMRGLLNSNFVYYKYLNHNCYCYHSYTHITGTSRTIRTVQMISEEVCMHIMNHIHGYVFVKKHQSFFSHAVLSSSA